MKNNQSTGIGLQWFVLAWVDSFKYLDVNISRTNNLSKGLNAACQQARKAQKVLDMHIMNHSTVSLNHIFELFDSLIKPILMYGCAVWGYGAINEIEAYHLQFMKRSLGVKVTTILVLSMQKQVDSLFT